MVREKKKAQERRESEAEKNAWEKTRPRKKKNYWPSKLTPGGQFHPIHEIPERDFLDGALVGAGSLRP
jgi:hypothetical protein